MKIRLLFFFLTMFVALNVNAQPPDPCDDCFLEYFLGNLTPAELDQCLIDAGCQDVPISMAHISYLFFFLTGATYYFFKTKKIKFPFINL